MWLIFVSESWEDNWVYSEHPGKEFGKFVWSSGKFYNDAEKDKGMILVITKLRSISF